MSAAQPKPTETKPSEPSMEEILASIRRIISDDQARPAAKAAPEPPAPAPAPPSPEARLPDPVPPPPPVVEQEEEEEILELSPKAPRDEMGKREREPHFITDDPVDGDVSFDDTPASQTDADVDALMSVAAEVAPEPPAPQPVIPPMPAAPLMPEVPEPDNDRLLSPTTGRMVSSAFNSLANTVLSNNARTLDDLVHEMLRPLIKSWLDENLPTVVERLVRAEIERVARGGR
jgi:cell pole-organizing protein PopZ